jgi:CheY-like chemotaxis protein
MQSSSNNAPTWSETPSPWEHATPLAAEGVSKLPSRLLIAEDARCVQHNLRSILEKMQVQADIVENGQMACDMVEKSKAEGKPYDLILMDIQMPHMNGYKAVEWIRQRGWQGPIVAVSAFASEEDHQKILRAGCNDLVAKPVNAAKLRDIFLRHLGENVRVATNDERRLGENARMATTDEPVVLPITFL